MVGSVSSARLLTCRWCNFLQLRQIRYGRNVKRFYKQVTVKKCDDQDLTTGFASGFQLLLDGKPLKTPFGKTLVVPHATIADRLADEWGKQKDRIVFEKMHGTTLCNTVLENPSGQTPQSLTNTVVDILQMDTLSFRMDTPPELSTYQKTHWDPLLSWFGQRFSVRLGSTYHLVPEWNVRDQNLSHLDKFLLTAGADRHKLSGSETQPAAEAERRVMWFLVPFTYATECIKSAVLCSALVDGQINLEETIRLSQLEREFQLRFWQRVDWHHDVTDTDLRERLSVCVEFCTAIRSLFETNSKS